MVDVVLHVLVVAQVIVYHLVKMDVQTPAAQDVHLHVLVDVMVHVLAPI